MTSEETLAELERLIVGPAARCAQVEDNASRGDVCWISRVYDKTWNKQAVSDWDTDKRALSKAFANHVASLLADSRELRRLRAERQWQAIDSAPKDGTEIIFGWAEDAGDTGAVAVGYWMGKAEQNYWRETGWFTSDEDVLCHHPIHPTHWQPLPEPPAADALKTLNSEV